MSKFTDKTKFATLLYFLWSFQLVKTNSNIKENIHMQMTEDEVQAVFGSNKVPDYQVVQLVRHSRSKRDSIDSGEEVIEIPFKNDRFVIYLKRNTRLMATPLRVEEIESDKLTKVSYITTHPDCVYHGNVIGTEDGSVAISTCGLPEGQMTGVIHHNGSHIIRPVPHRLVRSENHPDHIVYKSTYDINSYKCPHDDIKHGPENWPSSKRLRRARDTEKDKNKTIETAVFIDDVLYQKFQKENPNNFTDTMVNMVFTFINAVQLIYSQNSLTSLVSIVLVQVSVIKRPSVGPSKRQGNIEDYLESFCNWQARRNPKSDHNSSHWDHALMLTGMDLYMDEPDNTVVIGLAWVSGMCRRLYSCSINEGTTFESVFVISHELGHNLGMQHDGEKNKNDCSETDYIMSSSLGPGKTTWSSCSNENLKEFFNSPASICLNDRSFPKPELDHRSRYLPGQIYPAAVQCKSSYGSKYKPYLTDENPFNNVCRELWCANGTVARRAHPALDGTTCKSQHQCFHGKCVHKQMIHQQMIAYNLLPPESREPLRAELALSHHLLYTIQPLYESAVCLDVPSVEFSSLEERARETDGASSVSVRETNRNIYGTNTVHVWKPISFLSR
ncbi:hypothetical protein CHUAL_003668 [Chamberlinius hualienensis]